MEGAEGAEAWWAAGERGQGWGLEREGGLEEEVGGRERDWSTMPVEGSRPD